MELDNKYSPNTEYTTNKIGRRYVIEKDDKLYQRLLGKESTAHGISNLRFARTLVPWPHTILDVGMNIGQNTIEYGTYAKRVIGFEPTPWVYKWALQNIDYNQNTVDLTKHIWKDVDLDITADIETHNLGLSTEQATVTFLNEPKNNGHNHVLTGKRNLGDTIQTYSANITTMDSFGIENVDYIKIDTEGHELRVCEGGVKTIEANRPVVQCEVVQHQTQRFDYTVNDLWDFFISRDYRVLTRDGIERTQGITTGPYNNPGIFQNGEKIRGQMEYWFIPCEHKYWQEPKWQLFEETV